MLPSPCLMPTKETENPAHEKAFTTMRYPQYSTTYGLDRRLARAADKYRIQRELLWAGKKGYRGRNTGDAARRALC